MSGALLSFANHCYVVLKLKTQPGQPYEIRIVVNYNHTNRHGRLLRLCGTSWHSIVCAMPRDMASPYFRGLAAGQGQVRALLDNFDGDALWMWRTAGRVRSA